jgi:hypothetical protein
MTLNVLIPNGTQLKYLKPTVASVALQNRFSAAIIIVSTAILQSPESSAQLLAIAANTANNSSALALLTAQAIQFALARGFIVTSSSTLLDNALETFDDTTVTDSTILSIVVSLTQETTLLTRLGYGS